MAFPAAAASSSASALEHGRVRCPPASRPRRSSTARAPRHGRVRGERPELLLDDQLVRQRGADRREVRVAHADAPVGVRARQRETPLELHEAAHLARPRAIGRAAHREVALETVLGPIDELRPEPDDEVGLVEPRPRDAGVTERLLPRAPGGVALDGRPRDVPHSRLRGQPGDRRGHRGAAHGPGQQHRLVAGRSSDATTGRRRRPARSTSPARRCRGAPKPGQRRGPDRTGPSATPGAATVSPRPLASSALGVTRMGRPSRVRTRTGVPSITV